MMNTIRSRWHPLRQRGTTLLYAVAMSTLLFFTAMAYLKWSASTHLESRRYCAEIQAYYTAQAAIIQGSFTYLRSHPRLPKTWSPVIAFNDGWIAHMGRFREARINAVGEMQPLGAGNFHYDCSAIGIATYFDVNGRQHEVQRRVFARVSRGFPSSYVYFTDIEQTRFGEAVYFFQGDSIFSGRVHSNSDIFVHPGAYFGGLVTTTGRIMSPQGSTFAGRPYPGYFEHVKPIPMPVRADRLRAAAAQGGFWFNTSYNQYIYGLWFHGASATIWRWIAGTPDPPYLDFAHSMGEINWSAGSEQAIYCDGELWICGSVHGRVGVGARGNIRLMDNIVYSQSQPPQYAVDYSMTDALTLVSEAPEPGNRREDPWTGILVANTWANGRENHSRDRDIVIHAQLFALNSSFTFEQHNDSWDPYQAPATLMQDERGYIYLTGAVAQHRRGYFHRNNHGGTGYLRRFRYDQRFMVAPPPFQVEHSNQSARLNVEGWFDDYANRKTIGEAPYEQKYPAMETSRR